MSKGLNKGDLDQLAVDIKRWAGELGFQRAGIAGVDLPEDEARLGAWLEKGFHGEMDYMARHGTRRSRPAELVPGTLRVISVRMDYLPHEETEPERLLEDSNRAYISRYALGRDYHKVIRPRLQKLADRIVEMTGPFGYRAFVDSAPVLEKALARDAGLGWIGKHSNLLSREAGSWFFLGELFTDLPLPIAAGATTPPAEWRPHELARLSLYRSPLSGLAPGPHRRREPGGQWQDLARYWP